MQLNNLRSVGYYFKNAEISRAIAISVEEIFQFFTLTVLSIMDLY